MAIFYDTNALLQMMAHGDEPEPGFYISIQTLYELENIKNDSHKDGEIKYNARKLTRWLDEHDGDFSPVCCDIVKMVVPESLAKNPDIIICNDAFCTKTRLIQSGEDLVFCTEDICCKNIAKYLFKLETTGLTPDEDDYVGYKTIGFEDSKLPEFYMMLNEEVVHENIFDLKVNEYLLILDEKENEHETYYWDGHCYERVKRHNFKTNEFGDIKPYKNDPYQVMAMDCLSRNKISMLCGPAGSGKSHLALAYLFRQLEKNEIDKIIVFCNTVSTKNAARIGFLPGTRTEKLMESSIGNMLSSKLGESARVEQLISNNQLIILPMCDIRGYDTSDMKAGIYITEAQNMDIELMKLALQRVGSDCFVIIDGDHEAQVDMSEFAGNNNGMKRLSKIFRGQNFYGEVKLQKIYRSKIAELAQLM